MDPDPAAPRLGDLPGLAGPLDLGPFRALRLAGRAVGDPASAREMVRPYREVTARLADWERRGEVSRDTEPALWIHEWTSQGITVRGLVGSLDLTRHAPTPASAAVLPHERVVLSQVDELASRMRDLQVNPAAIMLVHRGSPALRAEVQRHLSRPPDAEHEDRQQQRHRLWRVDSEADVARLSALVTDLTCLVADGHHRYAAYLRMQQEAVADRGLAVLVDHEDTPLFLGAIHRVVGASMNAVADAASKAGIPPRAIPPDEALDALRPRHAVLTDGQQALELAAPPGDLAVTTLHRRLLCRLGTVPRTTYHHSVDEALSRVAPGRSVAALLPAPRLEALLETVASGRLLPQKSTSFQPKPSTGVLMRSLRDG